MRTVARRAGWRRVAVVALLCVVCAAAPTAQVLLDRVLVRVNDEPITLTDVQAAIGLGVVTAPSGDGAFDGAFDAALAQLVARRLQLAEVDRVLAPQPDAALVAAEVAQLRAAAGDGLADLMAATGIDEGRIEAYARDTLRLRSYLAQRFGTAVQVTDDEAVRFYQARPDLFTRDGVLQPFGDVAARARQLAGEARRGELIAQWARGLRMRADVVELPR
ncbi:MAG: hypothetical protein AB7G23_18605 [Vicinamibacterales bacterium]